MAKHTLSPDSTPFKPPKSDVDMVCAVAVRALSGIMVVFPDGHPVRGVALAELGKLLCVDVDENAVQTKDSTSVDISIHQGGPKFPGGAPRLEMARDFLLQARAELRKGFGSEGGEVGLEVEDQIRNVEKEWMAWKKVVRQGGLDVER